MGGMQQPNMARCIALALLEASNASHASDLTANASNATGCLLPEPMLLELLGILRLGILGLLLGLLQLVTHKGALACALAGRLPADFRDPG